ncbi:Protein of unknown function [Bacillus mycoides]|nr:Protein of unknown function [Bacillus mycoides]
MDRTCLQTLSSQRIPLLIRNTTIQVLDDYKAITNKQIAQGL